MAKPTKYDLVIGGKKLVGAAQRKKKQGYLHQGSISLIMPDFDYLEKVLLPEVDVIQAMKEFTFPLLGEKATQKIKKEAVLEIKHLLEKGLNIDILEAKLRDWQMKRIKNNPKTSQMGSMIISNDDELAFWPNYENQGPKIFSRFKDRLDKISNFS